MFLTLAVLFCECYFHVNELRRQAIKLYLEYCLYYFTKYFVRSYQRIRRCKRLFNRRSVNYVWNRKWFFTSVRFKRYFISNKNGVIVEYKITFELLLVANIKHGKKLIKIVKSLQINDLTKKSLYCVGFFLNNPLKRVFFVQPSK